MVVTALYRISLDASLSLFRFGLCGWGGWVVVLNMCKEMGVFGWVVRFYLAKSATLGRVSRISCLAACQLGFFFFYNFKLLESNS